MESSVRPAGNAIHAPVPTAPSRAARRAARMLTSGLPVVATLTAVLILARHDEAPGIRIVDTGAMVLLLLAGVWQTLLVYEGGRLLAAARQAHEELEIALAQRAEADSRYRLLVEQVPAAVYIDVADEGVSDGGRLAYMSPQVEAMLGYRPQEFLGDPELWPRLIHAGDRDEAISAYQQHWRTGRPLRAEEHPGRFSQRAEMSLAFARLRLGRRTQSWSVRLARRRRSDGYVDGRPRGTDRQIETPAAGSRQIDDRGVAAQAFEIEPDHRRRCTQRVGSDD